MLFVDIGFSLLSKISAGESVLCRIFKRRDTKGTLKTQQKTKHNLYPCMTYIYNILWIRWHRNVYFQRELNFNLRL